MSTKQDTSDTDGTERVEYPELQDGWEWWSGNTSRSYYTLWFGTEYRQGGDLVHDGCIGGYEGEVYWDRGNDHTVCLYPLTGIRDDGDPRVSEYAEIVRSYDSKQEAVNAVPDLICELKERHG
jgi:hypothetical protein